MNENFMPWIKVTVDDNNIQHMSIGVDEVFITFSAPKNCTGEQIIMLDVLVRNAEELFDAGLAEAGMI